MEKSLLHEFNQLPSSFKNTKGKTSFIRTFKDESVNCLNQSRIQNLPSYRKDNLSNRVQMVVIFQAIEIQRLSTQIQSLRVDLKDTERQMQNYLSYQIQIKELTQSISKTQQQNYQYQQQIKRLNNICQKMYSEIQELNQKNIQGVKTKLNELQANTKINEPQTQKRINQLLAQKRLNERQKQTRVNELQTQRKLNEVQAQNQILKSQIGRIINNHKFQTKQLEQNNKKLKKKVTFQDDQIQKTLKTIKSLQQNINNQKQHSNLQLINQLNRLKDFQTQSGLKYCKLIDLIDDKTRIIQNFRIVIKNRLNQTDQQKNAQKNYIIDVINQLKQVQQKFKINNQKSQAQNVSLNKTNNQLNIIVQQKVKQIKQKDRQIQQKDRQIQQNEKKIKIINNNLIESKQENNKIKQYEHNLNIIVKQKNISSQLINKLKNQNSQCLQLIDKQSKQLLSLSKNYSDQKNNLEKLINSLNNENTSINQKILTIQKQLNIKIKQLVELKSKIEKYRNQLNKNEDTIKSYYKISLQLQNIYENFNKQKNKSYNLEQKISDLELKNQNLLSNQNQTDNQLKILNDQINKIQFKLKQKDTLYYNEIQRCNNRHKNELHDMLQKNDLISKQLSATQSSYDKLLQQKSSEANKNHMKIQQLKEICLYESDLMNKQLKKFEYSEKLIRQVKAKTTNELQKNAYVMQCTIKKMAQIFKINQMFMDKIIALQNSISLLENQNLKLTSENKLLNFQMVETHKINSMQKRRNSRNLAENEQSFKNIKSSLGDSIALSSRTNSFIKIHNHKDYSTSQISEAQTSERKILNMLPPKMYSNK